MSIEKNKALVRRILEEVSNKRNLALIDELFSPEYVNHSLPPGVPHDREGYKQMIKMNHTAFPDFHITIEDVIAEKDRVVVRFNWSGTHQEKFMGIPPTGKHIVVNTICIYRVEGGKIMELWAQVDLQGMMKQLGVVQASGPGKK